ncbi:MAG: nucleotidyl transferase AbiEii/AbiGii toxin family protein [Spirochaetota bacterium]
MEKKIEYKELYNNQDRVLDAIFQSGTVFYLTGGTCLGRFYFEKRYSEDLDLFTSDNTIYREEVRILLDKLDNQGIEVDINVDTRDFVRITADSFLQIDMVNDRVYRHGRSVRTEKGYMIDNLENITANKIGAIISRDEPKDVFDLYIVSRHRAFHWSEILSIADKKNLLDKELMEYRLRSFPLDLVNTLAVTDPVFLKQFYKDYPVLVAEIINERENSLIGAAG